MNEKQHDDYPALKFTCEGGPLDGELFGFPKGNYVRGGTTPHIAKVLKEGIRISTLRRVGAARVPVAGKYRVEFLESEGTYAAVHVPSGFDVYFRSPNAGDSETAMEDVGRRALPSSADPGPVAASPAGIPFHGVIPQSVSTLANSGFHLKHGQG